MSAKPKYELAPPHGDRIYWQRRVAGDSRVEEISCDRDWFWRGVLPTALPRVLACSEGGQTGYCDLDKGHGGAHLVKSADGEERWFDEATVEQMRRDSSIQAHQLMKNRRERA